MNIRLLFLLLTCMAPVWLLAQTDTTDNGLDQAIEDIMQTTETDAEVDYTLITDQLDAWRRRPLNLNKATADQLRALPGLSDLQIAALAKHLARFGPLAHLNELQVVEYWYAEAIRGIRPYVTVADLPDLTAGEWTGDFTQRFFFLGQQQRGYSAPNPATGDTNRYAGAPVQVYSRLRARMGKHFSLALVGEKDRGETFSWNPDQRQYGYDFVGGHVALQRFGPIEALVVGDYTLAFGQGLGMSRGLGLGKGASLTTVKGQANGLRPYASVNEATYMRGIAATLRLPRQWRTTGFVSHTRRDGAVSTVTDTLTNEDFEENASASSIQVSGLHRTSSEITNRRTIAETVAGGRFEHKTASHTVGATAFWQHYSPGIQPNSTFYNTTAFAGNTNTVIAADADVVWRNANFFGEVARSQSGGIAATGGVLASLHPTFDVALLARSFDRDFHNSYGFAFAERPTSLSNERGLYLGGMFKPNRKLIVTGYADQYFFPYARYGAYFPTHGQEYLVQAEFIPKKGTSIIVRYRSDAKEENVSSETALPGPRAVEMTRRQNLRLHYRSRLSESLTLSGRIEWSHFTRPGEMADGFLAYQDVSLRAGRVVRLVARYAVFHAPDYDARIYAYENNVVGAFSIPAYYGIGSRWYLMAVLKPYRQLDIWLRVAHSQFATAEADRITDPAINRYQPAYYLGSGLDEIQGLAKTECTVQVRWRW